MQVADFLTKSLGAQVHHKLVDEAVGKTAMANIERFSRRDWKGIYDANNVVGRPDCDDGANSNEQETLISTSHSDNTAHHDDAQGGMLRIEQNTCTKTKFVDIVNLNRMIVNDSNNMSCLMCDSMEDYNRYQYENYVKSEQHRLDLVSQVTAEDMKVEKKYYGNVVTMSEMHVGDVVGDTMLC